MHLLGSLGLDNAPDVLPIYIGDDRTDEDAFRLLALRPAGFGILVSSRVRLPTYVVFKTLGVSESGRVSGWRVYGLDGKQQVDFNG